MKTTSAILDHELSCSQLAVEFMKTGPRGSILSGGEYIAFHELSQLRALLELVDAELARLARGYA